jgi:outer membrane protein assembly factor BamA
MFIAKPFIPLQNLTLYMRYSFLLVSLLFRITLCQASDGDTSLTVKKEKIKIKPVPVISYAPETRFLFGIGALAAFQLKRDTNTHYSLVSVFVAYTQNNQDYIYIPYQLYSKNNNYYFEGEADYYNYSYYYWGIGTDRVPKELYNIHFPRLLFDGYRKLTSNFYVGLDYYLEDDMIVGTQPGGELSKGLIPGSKGSISSGFGFNAFYDTRDSVYFPTKGWYLKASSFFNAPAFGASSNYSKVITDVSYYRRLSNPIVLALNEHTQFTWGDVPFNQLALVGGSKQMRGYYTGYYRDDILTYFQAEARIHLIGRFGFDAFGSVGLLGNYNIFPESNSPIFAEGIGLRYDYEKKEHVNLRLDVGYGTTVEFYLTILEGF